MMFGVSNDLFIHRMVLRQKNNISIMMRKAVSGRRCYEGKFRAYAISTISFTILALGSARNPHVLRVRSG